MQLDERLREEAAAWAVRTSDPDFSDWAAFEDWLEQSPDHARAYDETLAAVDDAVEALRAAPVVANDEPRERHGRARRWLGGAIAASLAAVAIFALWPSGSTYAEETAPGEIRVIALADGSRVDLAGGSRIELDRKDPRFVRLDHGRALFTIRHNDAAPFRVLAGDDSLLDLGTVFDVRLDAASLTVAVGEGAVMFNPDRQSVRLDPGESLHSARGSDIYREFAVSPTQVGEWREGRLSFRQASLADVAAELTGATGLDFRAASNAPSPPVSGSILVAPVREDPRALGTLLGVGVSRQGDGWLIEPK